MDSEDSEQKIITAMSMDSRAGVDKIATETGLLRERVYLIQKKLVEKYDIKFVPEINIANLQKYEFLGMGWGKSKREILKIVSSEEAPSIGFEEYIALIDFKSSEPSNEEILRAMGDSYIPQYVARTAGQHSLFMYAVARHSSDITEFMYKFMNNLSKFNSTERLQFIYPTFGYFPFNNKLIEQMRIQSQYKKLLLALNDNAKVEFTSLTKEFGGVTSATVGSLYARLKEIGLVTRSTICIRKPEELIIKLFILSIVDRQKFTKNKDKFLLNFVGNQNRHYVFMADIRNPGGLLIIARFKTPLEEEEFKRGFALIDLGVEISESTILQSIYGNLGVRNFISEETVQYKVLQSHGLVKIHRRNKPIMKKQKDVIEE
ncbi:MAG: hypothetical protein ACREBF_02455 [Candidatus Micrarchaeales archaeon]